MARLAWDKVGERYFETGVDRGVLFLRDVLGNYLAGEAWNGLTAVTQSPSGAEANPQYADNIKYLNLYSAEDFGATVEAFTYPKNFALCDGSAEVSTGVTIGQQTRRSFGLAYRTRVGNDTAGTDLGYKIHLIYGAMASPTEKAHATINDSPEAVTFSWELTTTPVDTIPGYKPTAILTIDSTKVSAQDMTDLENIIWGSAGSNARMPLPAEVIDLVGGENVEVSPLTPAFDQTTDTLTIPNQAGVRYQVDGVDKADGASIVLTPAGYHFVQAFPEPGYKFPERVDTTWGYNVT